MCKKKKFIKWKEEISKYKARYFDTNVVEEAQEEESEIYSIFMLQQKHVKPFDVITFIYLLAQ